MPSDETHRSERMPTGPGQSGNSMNFTRSDGSTSLLLTSIHRFWFATGLFFAGNGKVGRVLNWPRKGSTCWRYMDKDARASATKHAGFVFLL